MLAEAPSIASTAASSAAYRKDFGDMPRTSVDSWRCRSRSARTPATFSGTQWIPRKSTFKPMVAGSNPVGGISPSQEAASSDILPVAVRS